MLPTIDYLKTKFPQSNIVTIAEQLSNPRFQAKDRKKRLDIITKYSAPKTSPLGFIINSVGQIQSIYTKEPKKTQPDQECNLTRHTKTTNPVSRILVALDHPHPSEVKSFFHEQDKKMRMGRKPLSPEEIFNIFLIPPSKRTAKHNVAIDDYLKCEPYFSDKPDYLILLLASSLTPKEFNDGEYFFRQGDSGDLFYFLLAGTVQIRIKRPGSYSESLVAHVYKGNGFGEHSLLNDSSRSASAVSQGKTKALSLTKSEFLKIMGGAYEIELRNMIATLKKYPLTAGLDRQGLKMVAEKLYTREFPAGHVIVRQNVKTEEITFIRSGKCAVFRDLHIQTASGIKTKTVLLGYIGPFTTVNEESAIQTPTRSPPKITVVCATKCTLSSITANGEWLKLNIHIGENKFTSISNEDLVKLYKLQRKKEHFYDYQKKYIADLLK